MLNNDNRLKQRFDNFEKALHYLENAMNLQNPDIFQKAGMIQFFEMCSELSCKLLKDYLEEQRFIDIKSPRVALKKSFEIGLINDGHEWLELLEDRNLTSHTYDEETVTEVEKLIREKYYPLLKDLYDTFKNIEDK